MVLHYIRSPVAAAFYLGDPKVSRREEVPIPEGLEFIDLIIQQERGCETETQSLRNALGDKGPKCLAALGTSLSLLDRLASCWWGCNGGDHMLEYLTGRAVASAKGALRLSFGGYYDESLALTRSIGEIANLFALFAADAGTLTIWKEASNQERWREFRPAQVRRKLAQLGAPQPVSDQRYAALCELAAHVNPGTRPQSHNPLLISGMGATFHQTGYLLTLNELAIPIAFVSVFAPAILKVQTSVSSHLVTAAEALAESIGSVNITDGHPRLTDEAIAKIGRLIQTAPPEDRAFLRQAILQLAEGGPPSIRYEESA